MRSNLLLLTDSMKSLLEQGDLESKARDFAGKLMSLAMRMGYPEPEISDEGSDIIGSLGLTYYIKFFIDVYPSRSQVSIAVKKTMSTLRDRGVRLLNADPNEPVGSLEVTVFAREQDYHWTISEKTASGMQGEGPDGDTAVGFWKALKGYRDERF